MIHPLTRERLETWVADFLHGEDFRGYPSAVAERAQELLLAWLVAACERRDVEPEDLSVDDLRLALLEKVARFDLPAAVHAHVPDLCKDFLADLEQQGRLADGRTLGLALAAARGAYERSVKGQVEPLARPGKKLGRNEPCPCGSGKKFKQCCMKR